MSDVDAPQHENADPSSDVRSDADEAEPSFLRWLGEVILLIAIAFALATGIKAFVVQPFVIPTTSMVPTLEVGDRVLVSKLAYRFGQPKPGDVVVFTSPDSEDMDLIKRVIAVGGQTVWLRDGIVYVDGKAQAEPYVNAAIHDNYTSATRTRIPDGYVWVMGDNRTNSRDSRYFGPRPVKDVIGKAFCIYWPFARLRIL